MYEKLPFPITLAIGLHSTLYHCTSSVQVKFYG